MDSVENVVVDGISGKSAYLGFIGATSYTADKVIIRNVIIDIAQASSSATTGESLLIRDSDSVILENVNLLQMTTIPAISMLPSADDILEKVIIKNCRFERTDYESTLDVAFTSVITSAHNPSATNYHVKDLHIYDTEIYSTRTYGNQSGDTRCLVYLLADDLHIKNCCFKYDSAVRGNTQGCLAHSIAADSKTILVENSSFISQFSGLDGALMRKASTTATTQFFSNNKLIIPSGTYTLEGNTIVENNTSRVSGNVRFTSLPTSDPSVAGELWNDSGTLKISTP